MFGEHILDLDSDGSVFIKKNKAHDIVRKIYYKWQTTI